VKRFKHAAKTSDGKPDDEMRCALATSRLHCPGLVRVLGEVPAVGDGSAGDVPQLVLELLSGWDAVAGPPSMDTCTRDVYRADAAGAVTARSAAALLLRLGDCLRQLHSVGIAHGDFYGHNILTPGGKLDAGEVKLSDLGRY
jgi:hypothetical protein